MPQPPAQCETPQMMRRPLREKEVTRTALFSTHGQRNAGRSVAGLCNSLFHFLNVFKGPACTCVYAKNFTYSQSHFRQFLWAHAGSAAPGPACPEGGHSSMQLIYSGGTGGLWGCQLDMELSPLRDPMYLSISGSLGKATTCPGLSVLIYKVELKPPIPLNCKN